MPKTVAKNTIKLPVRFGRFLKRKLDPRRRETLEDSLRIRESRWEERHESLNRRAAARDAHDAEQQKGRSIIRRWAEGLFDMIELGDVVFRLLSAVVRGVLRILGGLLEGLSIFDI